MSTKRRLEVIDEDLVMNVAERRNRIGGVVYKIEGGIMG